MCILGKFLGAKYHRGTGEHPSWGLTIMIITHESGARAVDFAQEMLKYMATHDPGMSAGATVVSHEQETADRTKIRRYVISFFHERKKETTHTFDIVIVKSVAGWNEACTPAVVDGEDVCYYRRLGPGLNWDMRIASRDEYNRLIHVPTSG